VAPSTELQQQPQAPRSNWGSCSTHNAKLQRECLSAHDPAAAAHMSAACQLRCSKTHRELLHCWRLLPGAWAACNGAKPRSSSIAGTSTCPSAAPCQASSALRSNVHIQCICHCPSALLCCAPLRLALHSTGPFTTESRAMAAVASCLTCTHLPSYHVSQKSQAIQNSPTLRGKESRSRHSCVRRNLHSSATQCAGPTSH
jgi:hypothetical protein